MLKQALLTMLLLVPSLFAGEILLPTSARIGATKFEAGRYSLKVQGVVVIFVDEDRGRSFSVVAKIEKLNKRATGTVVTGTTADGVQVVEWILIAGSDQKLVFQGE